MILLLLDFDIGVSIALPGRRKMLALHFHPLLIADLHC